MYSFEVWSKPYSLNANQNEGQLANGESSFVPGSVQLHVWPVRQFENQMEEQKDAQLCNVIFEYQKTRRPGPQRRSPFPTKPAEDHLNRGGGLELSSCSVTTLRKFEV